MSARRHRNDGSQQKPLHVWFSVRRRLFFNFGGCAGLYSKLTNCESYQKGWLPIRMGSLLFRTRNLRRKCLARSKFYAIRFSASRSAPRRLEADANLRDTGNGETDAVVRDTPLARLRFHDLWHAHATHRLLMAFTRKSRANGRGTAS